MRVAFFPLRSDFEAGTQDSQDAEFSLSRSHFVPAHSADRLLCMGIGKFDEANE